MLELSVVRVFVGPDGGGGNLLGVFVDGAGYTSMMRQEIAADLGFAETVFVEDAARGVLRIHTPKEELPLAGHPLVGTAWLLHRHGRGVDLLRPPAGEVPTWLEGKTTWIRARPEWAPPFELRQLESVAAVDEHRGAESEDELLQVWAWEDQSAGRVRVRVFPPRVGITEDEATGSAALLLAATLERELIIRQGTGSQILARPAPSGTVAVGGRSELTEIRSYPDPR